MSNWPGPFELFMNQSDDMNTSEKNEPQNVNRRYSEDFLADNVGKKLTAFVTITDSDKWKDTAFKGRLEGVGADYMVVRTGESQWDLLYNVNVEWIEFHEKVNGLDIKTTR